MGLGLRIGLAIGMLTGRITRVSTPPDARKRAGAALITLFEDF